MSNEEGMDRELTTRDLIFQFLITYKRQTDGDSPSLREIAQACAVSISTANYHLMQLEREGRIRLLGRRRIQIVGGQWNLATPENYGQDGHETSEDISRQSPQSQV